MPDAGFVFPPAFRVVTDAIAAVNGGYVEFYVASTSTPLTVYSDSTLSTSLGSTVYLDSGGHPVSAQGGSTKVVIYTGAALIKMVLKSSAGVTLATYDNVRCAQDTSALSGSGADGAVETIVSKTSDYTILLADDGKLFNCDPTGGTFTLTLPNAATMGAGYEVSLRHAGTTTTNGVKFVTVSGQTIARDNLTTVADTLTGGGETITLVSNGANWVAANHVGARMSHPMPIQVADRLTAAPSSPSSGAFYIINGTPTGDWLALGFTQHDLVRANGQGGWIRYVPTTDCGWLAFVQDEDLLVQFRGSAWVDLANITAPDTTYLKSVVLQYAQSNGTNGGTPTAGSRQTYPLNTFLNSGGSNVIAGATFASNKVTGLPVGFYRVRGWASFVQTDDTAIWFRNATTATDLIASGNINVNSSVSQRAIVPIEGEFEVTSTSHEFMVQYRCVNAFASTGLGVPSSFSEGSEIYGQIVIEAMATAQGPRGADGAQGATGNDASLGVWNWETSTSATPSSGAVRFNNATFASVTSIYLSETDANARNLSAYLATIDDSTSTSKAKIRFHENGTPTNFWMGTLTALTDNGSDLTLTVTHLASSGSFSAGDDICMEVIEKGDKGDTGATGGTGPIRELLSAARTYYVRTDGSDSNTGLANTAGGAFLTLQKAIDVAATLDTSIYDVTIQLAAGTYTRAQGWQLKSPTGAGLLYIVGDVATPSNVILESTGAHSGTNAVVSCVNQTTRFSISGVQLKSSGSGFIPGIRGNGNAYLEYGSIDFSTGLSTHVMAVDTAAVICTGNYSISAGAGSHLWAVNGTIRMQSYTLTLTGTPVFSNSFAICWAGYAATNGMTFSGSATGSRYSVTDNGVVFTSGGGASYLPGDSAGSTATGGQYT